MKSENKAFAKSLTTILLATRNKHERLPEIEETGVTFEENAKLKAEGISHCVDGLALADDSGLEVDALGKEPGVYSARYAGAGCTDAMNTALVLEKMKGIAHQQRTARFRCVLAVAEGGRTLATFDGTVEGILATEVRGDGGFGYDPIFMPIGYDQSFGELSSETKHTISHRSRALEQFKVWWAKRTNA
jgi:XTP/dITP diphosphohydrolase